MPDSIFSFFGLRENPFKINPDPRFLFETDQARASADELVYAVRNRKGLILLTGEVGTGKTMLVRRLLDWLAEERMPTALIFNSRIRPEHLLDFILNDFGVHCESDVKSDKLMALNKWLLDRYRAGQTPVLVVDEAQGLAPDTLEEVRLLLNFETPRDKLLQIVLAGQPELETMLKRHELRQLRQRITIRSRTEPLDAEQTPAYIRHRLRVAGASKEDIFEPDAAAAVYAHTRGIPRVINVLCEHAMVNACADASVTVSRTAVEQAASECQLDRAESVARILQTGSYSAAELANEINSILSAVSSRLGQNVAQPQVQAAAAGVIASSRPPAPAAPPVYFSAFERTFPNAQRDYSSPDAATSILAPFASAHTETPKPVASCPSPSAAVTSGTAAAAALAIPDTPEIETIPLLQENTVADVVTSPLSAEPQDVEVRFTATELNSRLQEVNAIATNATEAREKSGLGELKSATQSVSHHEDEAAEGIVTNTRESAHAQQPARYAPRRPENFRELLALWCASFARDARASCRSLQRQLYSWHMTYWNPTLRGMRREARGLEKRIVRFLSDPRRNQTWKQRWNELDAAVQRRWRATPMYRWLHQPLSTRKSPSDHHTA